MYCVCCLTYAFQLTKIVIFSLKNAIFGKIFFAFLEPISLFVAFSTKITIIKKIFQLQLFSFLRAFAYNL